MARRIIGLVHAKLPWRVGHLEFGGGIYAYFRQALGLCTHPDRDKAAALRILRHDEIRGFVALGDDDVHHRPTAPTAGLVLGLVRSLGPTCTTATAHRRNPIPIGAIHTRAKPGRQLTERRPEPAYVGCGQ